MIDPGSAKCWDLSREGLSWAYFSIASVGRSGADRRFGFRLRLQRHSDQAGGRQGGMGGSAKPVSAPRRPRSQSGRHRSGLRQAGKGRADPGHRGARQGDLDSPRRQRPDRPGQGQAAAGRAERAQRRARAIARDQRELSRISSRTRISSRCSPSSRARRTESPSLAATMSRRCRTSTPRSGPSRPCSGRRRCFAPSSRWFRSPPTPKRRRRRR